MLKGDDLAPGLNSEVYEFRVGRNFRSSVLKSDVGTDVGHDIAGPRLRHQMAPDLRLVGFAYTPELREDQDAVRTVDDTFQAIAAQPGHCLVIPRAEPVPQPIGPLQPWTVPYPDAKLFEGAHDTKWRAD